jgi:hypothetical protein
MKIRLLSASPFNATRCRRDFAKIFDANMPHPKQSIHRPQGPKNRFAQQKAPPKRGFLMILAGSKLAEQNQDQQNNNHKAEAAAPIVASPVKRAAADSTKAAQQCDYQDDEKDSPNRHFSISLS